ncbi:MAG: hypothetical protein HYX69_10850 [Planctomycetia bacterium]|nr:hypothetical protein [Planctomycetia bacterium]
MLSAAEPVAEAMVVFHPLSSSAEAPQKPLAYTDAEGQFALTTDKPNDGAPEGEYAITVELRAPRQIGEETVRDGPSQLPAKYARPETTPLRYRVVPGMNDVPPLAVGPR